MTTLTIFTACSRPHLLPKVAESIIPAPEIELKWVVAYDPGNADNWQKRALNAWLDSNAVGWLWILDDDNAVHPNFLREFQWLTVNRPTARAFVFDQQIGMGCIRKALPDNCRENYIDAAQYVVERSLVGDTRFPLTYSGDGAFIEALYRKSPEAFYFSSLQVTYYNRLRQ